MKYQKILAPLLVAVIASLALASNASANPLTSPAGTGYTSTVKAEAEGSIKLDGSFTTVECKKSTLEGKVESHAATTASGKLSSLTFTECNFPVTVLKTGSLELLSTSGGNGTVISTGTEIKVETSVGECVFSTNNVHIGTFTGSNTTNATIDMSAASIPRTAGNFLCGASGTLTGSYKVTTPSRLSMDKPGSPFTSPVGSAYTSTIKAESAGPVVLHGSFVSVSCNKSSAEGAIETHGEAVTTVGKLSSLTFSECNYPVTVAKLGSLEVHATGEGRGTVTSTGAEIIIATSVGNCIFTTSATDVGTFVGGNTARLEIGSSGIPRTGGSAGPSCGSVGTWTGIYKFNSPDSLYLDPQPEPSPPSPLTSPAGTSYAGTLKAEAGTTTLQGTFVTVECKKSTAEGKVESNGEISASGILSGLTFAECNYPVSVLRPGSIEVQGTGGGNGTVKSSGAEVRIQTSVGSCLFTTDETDIGDFTGGTTAKLDIKSASIPRTGGSAKFLCGASGTWNGSYTVSTPDTLLIDAPGSPLTSPAGTPYTSTIKAESEEAVTLAGSFITVNCGKSTLEGSIESHSETTAGGKLSGLTFGECNYAVTVLKPGSLEIHATGSGNGTVTSSGAEVTIHTSVGDCIFTTSSTDIGTFTGSTSTNATVDIKGAAIPRTGGGAGFLCGSTGTLNGSYKITTPSTLYMD